MKKIILLVWLGILVLGCEPVIEQAGLTTFSPHTVPQTPGKANASAFVSGENAYIVFGRNRDLFNQLWKFHILSGEWTRMNDFPGKARVGAVSAVAGNRIFAGLGFAGTENTDIFTDSMYLSDFWEYHIATDNWTRKATYPGNGRNKAAVVVVNEEIYVFNGFVQKGSNREVWKYNPDSDAWIRLNDYPGRHRYCTVAMTDGKRIFAGTGFNTLNNNEWWEYIPASDSWQKRKSMPDTGRCNATAFVVNGRFFVSTGRYYDGHLTGGHLKNDLLEYNPASDSWIRHTNLSAPPRENAISFVSGNRAYIGFGEDNSTIFNDLWSFTPGE
jgi:N-acetylneuraminic acid mutarotase